MGRALFMKCAHCLRLFAIFEQTREQKCIVTKQETAGAQILGSEAIADTRRARIPRKRPSERPS